MDLSVLPFDRELRLEELLPPRERARLLALLEETLGRPVRLRLPAEPLPGSGTNSVPLHWEMEVVGFLDAAEVAPDRLRGAARLVEVLMRHAAGLKMASELHLHTVQSDYETLREKHAALIQSEARFRELAARLEERVAEQVAEIRAGERKLFLAAKTSAMGQMAAGLAHEINNPLGFILSNLNTAQSYVAQLRQGLARGPADLAERLWGKDAAFIVDDFPELLKESLTGVQRVAGIVADMRVFAGLEQVERRQDDVNERLRTVVRMLRPLIPPGVEVIESCQPGPTLPCYPAQLGQAFHNILHNALLAVGQKGRIQVSTRWLENDVAITVADNGCGMSEDVLARIFDPFFTTREVGQGVGLGLTVSRDVVQAHHGRIQVSSRVGAGSTFTILLPLSHA